LNLDEELVPFDWILCHPSLLLSKLVTDLPVVAEQFAIAARAREPSAEDPWSLVVSFDEYSPGNQMKIDNRRKSMVLSFTFLELGTTSLRRENMWFTPVVLRSKIIARVDGEWSRCLRLYLELQLFSESGLATAGVAVMINNQPLVIYARLARLLADGDGLRSGFSVKGARGIKPCLKHFNVLRKDSNLVGLPGSEDCVEITCCNPASFKRATSIDVELLHDTLAAASDRVAAGTMTAARMKQMEQVFGINCSPHGLMRSPALRRHCQLLSTATYDWMHCFLQHGIMNVEMYLFLERCQAELNIGFVQLRDFFLVGWAFPKKSLYTGKQLWRVFDNYRMKASERSSGFRAQAQELVAVYGITRHWAHVVIGHRPEVANERLSFDATCATLDCILLYKRGALPWREAGQALRTAHSAAMTRHIAVYGARHILPKHHWVYDVADQWDESDMCLDCFVVERLNKRAKAQAEHACYLGTQESSILAGTLHGHYQMARSQLPNGLRGRTAVHGGAVVGDRIEVNDVDLAVGDFIFFGDDAGLMRAAFEEHGTYFIIAEKHVVVREV